MKFVPIRLENIQIGAAIVRKNVFEEFGLEKVIICTLNRATYHIPIDGDPYIELEVYNPRLKATHIFRSHEFLIQEPPKLEPIDMNNPNRTFTRREEH